VVWAYAPGICDGKTLDVSRIRKWTGTEYGTPGPVSNHMGSWTSVYCYDFKTITPAMLKDTMRKAGVHMFTDEENPVFANERLFALHFSEGGTKTVYLPRRCRKVIDVIKNAEVDRNCTSFRFTFSSPDTAIFEMIV
jgi:hypothetical protein